MSKLNGLGLFEGIGGITLALMPWVRPIAYCEIDRFAQAVVLSRMADGRLPTAPIWDDIRTLGASQLPEIDIIYGGFPCQDLSVAGNGAGLAGERSGLFFEVERIVSEIRPRFLFLENVPAIRTRGADIVCGRLASLGYDCRWGVLSAFDMGAPHLRERWWLLAHGHGHGHGQQGVKKRDGQEPKGRGTFGTHLDRFCDPIPDANRSDLRDEQRRRSGTQRDGQAIPGNDGETESMADSLREGLQEPWSESIAEGNGSGRPTANGCHAFDQSWWLTEPAVGRVVNGLSHRPHRIKALGNAVVPLQARQAFVRLMGL